VATNPPLDVVLTPINGEARTLGQWLTTFHLVLAVVDPFTNESAWLLPTAARILSTYDEADCRVAWLVTGTVDECRQFLGPWSKEILTLADPDRTAVRALGLSELPALVDIGLDGTIIGAAEGWDPSAWREVTDTLSRLMRWSKPVIPTAGDPAPYAGSPALT
jgi:hypothetical protein